MGRFLPLDVLGTACTRPAGIPPGGPYWFRASTNSPTAATTCCTAQADADGAAIKQYKNTASSSTRDRKSTRLNSSHVSISYAVFCLKKKTKDHKKYTKKNDINNNRKI